MIKQLAYPVILLLALVAYVSCKQDRAVCLTPTIASLNIVFMHLPSDTSTTVFVDTGLPSAVFVALTRTQPDSTLPYPQQSNFTLSLSSDTTFCQWLFKTDTTGSIFDTLSFYYQRNLQFLSNACGFAYFYTLDSVHTTHYSLYTPYSNIDSAHIINPSVTNNVNTTQILFYIHPDW